MIYSKDFQDKLCDEYAAGSLPIKAVAEAHGIGRTTLQSWLFKRGISKKKKEGKMGTKKPQTVTSSSEAKPGNSKACGLYRDAYQRLQTAFQAYMEAGSLFEAARSAERVFK